MNSLIDSPVRVAQSTPDPRVAGSIPSLDREIFFPPAQCFVWYLEIFHTQNNGGFISIILFYLTLLKWIVGQNRWSQKRRLPELPFAIRADDFMLGLD